MKQSHEFSLKIRQPASKDPPKGHQIGYFFFFTVDVPSKKSDVRGSEEEEILANWASQGSQQMQRNHRLY